MRKIALFVCVLAAFTIISANAFAANPPAPLPPNPTPPPPPASNR